MNIILGNLKAAYLRNVLDANRISLNGAPSVLSVQVSIVLYSRSDEDQPSKITLMHFNCIIHIHSIIRCIFFII